MEIRVTVRFTGRKAGALGISYEQTARRTISVPSPFTYAEAKEAARRALYDAEGDSPAHEHVSVISVAFN